MNLSTPAISTHGTGIAKEQIWKDHARRQKESGLSRKTYCCKHQLSYDQFGYWERKWRQEASFSNLVPIHLNSPTKIAAEIVCTLSLQNGHELKIHDKALLPMLLSLLS